MDFASQASAVSNSGVIRFEIGGMSEAQLSGFHAREEFQGEPFRWTEPAATLRLDVPSQDYEVTIEDPHVFTRPWTISMPLYRRLESNAQLLEYPCVEFVEEFMYGDARSKQLVKHWEGDSIVIDITRKMRAEGVR